MNPKARLWIGSTLLAVILINYVFIGVPLLSKSNSIHNKAKAILIKQARSGSGIFDNSDDDYLLDIFRKEKSAIDTKITILNAVAVTLTLFAASWTVFGLIFKKK